ncbi:hypothetical protein IIE_05290 [Bacillus cereus VD045]|nr:hypothetical protein IIE_05290 [Bacillus cereus VD045]HDR4350513.1 trypsin-like peptidase domain-containing protein [Bacillus cereus]HDR6957499.1 trypsin-like peptidase domain-containing protein [Bacillus cereus]
MKKNIRKPVIAVVAACSMMTTPGLEVLAEEENRLKVSSNIQQEKKSIKSDGQGRIIIGEDDRIQILDTMQQPYQSIVYVRTSNGTYGTGFVVDKDTVITNAHVAQGNHNNPSGLEIYPARNGNNDPLGSFKVDAVHIPDQYNSAAAGTLAMWEYDLAVLKISPRDGVSIGDVSEPLELKNVDTISNLVGKSIHSVGYPGDKPRGTMWSANGNILNEAGPNGYLIRHNFDTAGGQSGSPVFDEENRVIAIHSSGNATLNVNTAVKLNTTHINYINSFIDKGSEENKESLENRIFEVQGKGNVQTLKQKDRRLFSFSPYEPTGLYAKPNEEIIIQVKGNQSINAYIGTYSYNRDSEENELVKSFTLKPGANKISSSGGGMIYFYNEQENGTIQATVEKGGSPVPYFELGKSSKQDLINMLDKYPDAHAVELKGERVLITASPTRVKKYLLDSNTDPAQLLKKMDEATRIQDKISDLSEEQVDKHYIHYVEDNQKSAYMYATEFRTGYVGDAIQNVLDINKFTKDGWGPWHEAGHMRQQQPWNFHNMTEVQVNLYSLAVQTAFGNTSRLETQNDYAKAFQYLDKDANTKDYDQIDDVFVKLVMLWQLQLAYGDDFYPTLHQQYRDMPDSELPTVDEEKKQVFMVEASKAAKQNLLPFFEQWGLKPNQDTINKINQLGYPLLVDPIWKGTDSKPIKPNNESILKGSEFSWSMQGIGDREFATINLNKSEKAIKVDLKEGIPHHYFDETYASIKVKKESGQVVYDKEIYGNAHQNAETKNVPVEVGNYIELTHLEGDIRATLINVTNNKQEKFGNTVIYQVTKEGLKKVEASPAFDTEAPTAPTELRSMGETETTVDLMWKAATDNVGVDHYEVYRNGERVHTNISDVRVMDTGLQANTEYTYEVKAIDAAGNVSKASKALKVKTKQESMEATTTWDKNKVYNAGDRIMFNGYEYEAKWWTQGNQPDSSDAWKLLGDAVVEWNKQKPYQGGEQVQYQGTTYKAKWWTQGEIPGESQVWEKQ